jgi:hypothetical protein
MLKHCSSTASGNAQALPQACRRLTVCGWGAGPMAIRSRSGPAKIGAVTGPILDSKICSWPRLGWVGRIAVTANKTT